MKPANKAGQPAAEWVEQRAGTKGNTGQPHTRRTQSRGSVSQGLDRVRQAARQRKKERFTALLHHVTVDLLREAFLALKRHAAPGVDGVTWQDYEADLESEPPGPARTGPSRHVSGAARAATVHTEAGRRQAAPAGYRRAGRQDRPACGGRGAQCHLRGRLPRVLVRVPARTQPARCAGCTVGGDLRHPGELDSRRRHSELLRPDQPGMVGPVPGASDRRRARHPSCAQVAQGGRPGRRGVERQ